MKATEAPLLKFLKESQQFIIPIYQRTYSWTETECGQLWDDIIRTGSNKDIAAHFVGSIVYIEKGLYQVSSQSQLLVIDGQQRLTTVSILLEALARKLDESEPVEGFSALKIRLYYLLNQLEKGEKGYKLILTQTDKDTLIDLVQQKDLQEGHSIRVKENFEFFEKKITALKGDYTSLCKGLAKLVIVDISLNHDQDNPQLIFESMNSTGKELSQADLIRNFILMGLDQDLQAQLYTDHWRRMEVLFGQEAYGQHFDGFMRHYLTFNTGDIPNKNKVYEAFKDYSRSPRAGDTDIEELVSDVHKFAGYYCNFALGKEPDKKLRDAFNDIRELKVDTSYPFLLELYQDYATGILSKDDLLEAVQLIDAYVFRRAVSTIPTNSLNKTFSTFTKALEKDRYLESIKAHFLLLPSYRRFPNDEEFKREIKSRDLYNKRTSYYLRKLENHGRKEPISVSDYTIEHIMPQNKDLSAKWRKALGNDWKSIHETWLHTLGNLTLTGYNSEYSDHPFPDKRDMEGGFRESTLRLNRGLGDLDTWNEETIQARADTLATKAANVWAAPSLPPDRLDEYKPESEPLTEYSMDDLRYLAVDRPMRPVFEAFRNAIKAFDPCVSVEYLKRYVVFRAEESFVYAAPKANEIRLYLALPFHDVKDPKGLCTDVSERRIWVNAEVKYVMESTKELSYVVSLVRQAFEKQMGNGDSTE